MHPTAVMRAVLCGAGACRCYAAAAVWKLTCASIPATAAAAAAYHMQRARCIFLIIGCIFLIIGETHEQGVRR